MKSKKLKIAVDFDGVLNSYKSGWQGLDKIEDPPVPGAINWLCEAIDAGHTIIIFSMRCASEEYMEPFFDEEWSSYCMDRQYEQDPDTSHLPYDFSQRYLGVTTIEQWLLKWGLDQDRLDKIQFAYAKPHCNILIDDRGYRFEGSFPSMEELQRLNKP